MNEPPLLRRWEAADALVRAALDVHEADRTAFVEQRAAGDPELRDLVLTLLASADPASETGFGGPLSRELLAAVAPDLEDAADGEAVGQRVGRYRLLRRIGRGGAGTVFEAERDDGSFTQRVAIKLLRRGLDTDDILARFRAERQILASMSHPNIARLLDGGATEDGRPYLAMELVHGQALDAWCAATRAPLESRLDLFLQVAAAVEYAHRSLVVHRDLKPSNILVTGDGTVKLLDFGIARLLDEGPDAATLTRTGLRPMTPGYASPEQRAGGVITTASDIYQLGLILYELCSGVAASATGGASVIAPPSAVAPAALRRRLRGDIDTIAMTALRDEPERRYGTVQQLADDVRRHLRGYPIEARPDDWAYRAHRFVTRNRAASAGAVAAVLALMAWGGTAAVQARRLAIERNVARVAAAQAIAESARSQRVTEFLVGLFEAADPGNARGVNITARELLDQGVAQAERLSDEPATQAELLAVMARVHRALGAYDRALPLAQSVLEMRRASNGPPGAVTDLQLADALNEVAIVLRQRGDLAGAEAMHRDALALRSRHLGPVHSDIAESLSNLGLVLRARGSLPEAESAQREALAMHTAILGPRHPAVARTLNNLAVVLRQRGDLAGAESAHREALAIRRDMLGASHPDVAQSLNNLGVVVRALGNLAEAELLHREALAIHSAVYDDVHPERAASLSNLGLVLRDRGDLEGAEAVARESLGILRRQHGDAHPAVASALSNLGVLQRQRGDLTGAEASQREALDMRIALFGENHTAVAGSLNNLAQVLRTRRLYDEAEELMRRALAVQRALLGSEHPDVALTLNNLGLVALDRGDLGTAERSLRAALDMRRTLLTADHPDIVQTLSNLGLVLRDAGDWAEAEHVLTEAVGAATRTFGEAHARTVFAAGLLEEVARRKTER